MPNLSQRHINVHLSKVDRIDNRVKAKISFACSKAKKSEQLLSFFSISTHERERERIRSEKKQSTHSVLLRLQLQHTLTHTAVQMHACYSLYVVLFWVCVPIAPILPLSYLLTLLPQLSPRRFSRESFHWNELNEWTDLYVRWRGHI